MKKLYFLALSILLSSVVLAQSLIKGTIKSIDTGEAIEGALVTIQDTKISALTDEKGRFKLYKVSNRSVVVIVQAKDYQTFTQAVEVKEKIVNLGELTLAKPDKSALANSNETIQVISLDNADASEASDDQNVASQVGASRDLFRQITNYSWGAIRYRQRGYLSNYTEQYFNGVPFTELDDDRLAFNSYGGLNDVTRVQQTYVGLESNNFAFGDLSGSINIDTRASLQRKQTRISYMNRNSNYRHRIMGTYSTGLLPNGWAFTASASRRWAQEGFIQGTFMEAAAYFLSIDKKINNKHIINLTAFASPSKQGTAGATVQEMFELSGTTTYNPSWGYQEGRKRNSKVRSNNSPTLILRHDYTPSRATTLTTSASFQIEQSGRSDVDWFNAPDPRPDYYSKLPSSVEDDKQRVELTKFMQENESARQLNWTNMYAINRNSLVKMNNVTIDGKTGQSIEGLRSRYVSYARRSDSKEANFYTNIQHQVAENQQFVGGLGLRYSKGQDYKELLDLLGGDFYVDVDQFAERDFPGTDLSQNDLRTPNRILKVGDKYGYNYHTTIRNAFAWGQYNYSTRHFDVFASAKGSYNEFWREGLTQNGRFPENSLGKSDKSKFLNYGTKAGVTYKLNGRNYFHIYGGYMTKAPTAKDAFLSPNTRNSFVPNLTNEKILAIEGGYNYRSPNLTFQATGFLTNFKDKTRYMSFFSDADRSYIHYVSQGLSYQHAGVELAAEWKPFSSLEVSAAGTIGQHIYTSRPTSTATPDNGRASVEFLNGKTIYIDGYYLPNTPQMASTLAFRYIGKKFWNLNASVNYFAKRYIDMNFNRRTEFAISNDIYGVDKLETSDARWGKVLDEVQLPDVLTVNVSGNKSFRIRKDYYLNLTVGVDNVLDNRFSISAFEQWRFSWTDKNIDKFPPKYLNAYGRNYFVMLALRF